jgi:hypothetical protein
MQQISSFSTTASCAQNIIFYSNVGNFIPPEWRNLSDSSGKALSKTSRQLLSLIVSCLESAISTDGNGTSQAELQESYYFFEQQLGVCQRRVRQCLLELEQNGFISLRSATVIKHQVKCRNILCVSLAKKFQPYPKEFSAEPEINFSPTRKNFQAHNIIDNNISNIKSRSGESGFLKNNFFENDSENQERIEQDTDKNDAENQNPPQIPPSNWISKVATKAKDFCRFKKKLEEFHPLTDEDAWLLQLDSGREFNLGFINKLLLKLAEQYPDHKFPSKKAVLNYMTKALTYELRDACKVNNEGFRFKQDSDSKAREEYLQKVEYSRDTDQTSQLRRKIAAVFEPEVAYKLLTSCSFNDPQGDCYKLPLFQDIVISESLQEALLQEARSVYGNSLNYLEIVPQFMASKSKFASKKKAGSEPSDNYEHLRGLDNKSVWYRIRKYLVDVCGAATDKSWFSKLEVVDEDQVTKKLLLKPQSAFFGSWITQNYQSFLEDAFVAQGFSFEITKF